MSCGSLVLDGNYDQIDINRVRWDSNNLCTCHYGKYLATIITSLVLSFIEFYTC